MTTLQSAIHPLYPAQRSDQVAVPANRWWVLAALCAATIVLLPVLALFAAWLGVEQADHSTLK